MEKKDKNNNEIIKTIIENTQNPCGCRESLFIKHGICLLDYTGILDNKKINSIEDKGKIMPKIMAIVLLFCASKKNKSYKLARAGPQSKQF